MGLSADSIREDSRYYLRFEHNEGLSLTNQVGKPALPYIPCFIAIPEDCALSVTASVRCIEAVSVCPVFPAPLDSTVHEPFTRIEEFFMKDSIAYVSDEWYPGSYAQFVGEFRLRDQRVAIINVYPVHFKASVDSLLVAGDIEVNVALAGAPQNWSLSGFDDYDRLIGDRIVNYRPGSPSSVSGSGQVYRHTDVSVAPPFDPDYVIVTADGLDGAWIDALASHRAALNGFNVIIALRDDIWDEYASSEPWPTQGMIRDYTESLWNWSDPGNRPTYLLLVGDHEEQSCMNYTYVLPTAQSDADAYGNYVANDDWFAMFDEPRSTYSAPADMIVGRLCAKEHSHIESMIDLIIAYEGEASTHSQEYLDRRRWITRLSGSDTSMPGGTGSDGWLPSTAWTDGLRQWLGYDWDNYYCGDGEDTWYYKPPNPDGSSMTSEEWVEACLAVFTPGSQLALYADHGHFHMFSAGLNWEEGGPPHLGVPDSVFDCQDIRNLDPPPDGSHVPPFLLSMCCTNGTFNHTESQHISENGPLCYNDDPEDPPEFDYGSDCLAESFAKNTECGAIGVFASALSSAIDPYYDRMGRGILEAVFYSGNSRTGDAITTARLRNLEIFWDHSEGCWNMELARFNLLGDPAVDIGDRVIFRDLCDLVVTPDDITGVRYPTRSVNSVSTASPVYVTVRNNGAVESGRYDVTLEIAREEYPPQTYSITDCHPLPPKEEVTHRFDWIVPDNFQVPVDVNFRASVSSSPMESWKSNNKASVTSRILGFYPNDDGWPVQTMGSVKSPPLLADIDEDGDLEIIAAVGNTNIAAWNHDSTDPIWLTTGYDFNPIQQTPGQDEHDGYTVPAAADIDGNGTIEIVVDTVDELLVLDGSDGSVLHSFQHEELQNCWRNFPHSPAVGDVVPESGITQLEIVLPVNDTLYILGMDNGTLEVMDSFGIKPSGALDTMFGWVSISDIDSDLYGSEVIVSGSGIYDLLPESSWTRIGLYSSSSPGSFYARQDWIGDELRFNGIPATGELTGSGTRIALSQRLGDSSHNPAFVLDPDNLSLPVGCVHNPSLASDKILCCMMADWFGAGGLDRIIAPAENQCFTWNDDGEENWFNIYTDPDEERPPFGALGNVDNAGMDDLIVGTREGIVLGYYPDGNGMIQLYFPYNLPSEVYGGFVIADIDNDGFVEVVFGTMDNYLHVWELGECSSGYSPWPQCQHDAMRTGVLE